MKNEAIPLSASAQQEAMATECTPSFIEKLAQTEESIKVLGILAVRLGHVRREVLGVEENESPSESVPPRPSGSAGDIVNNIWEDVGRLRTVYEELIGLLESQLIKSSPTTRGSSGPM